MLTQIWTCATHTPCRVAWEIVFQGFSKTGTRAVSEDFWGTVVGWGKRQGSRSWDPGISSNGLAYADVSGFKGWGYAITELSYVWWWIQVVFMRSPTHPDWIALDNRFGTNDSWNGRRDRWAVLSRPPPTYRSSWEDYHWEEVNRQKAGESHSLQSVGLMHRQIGQQLWEQTYISSAKNTKPCIDIKVQTRLYKC